MAELAFHHLNLRRIGAVDDVAPYTAGLAVALADVFDIQRGTVPVASTIDRGDTPT